MAETMTKAQLRQNIEEGWHSFDHLLGRFEPADMAEAVLSNGWTVGDLIGHIVVWEQRFLGWLAATARGEHPAIPAPGYTWDDLDRLNDETQKAQAQLDQAIEELMADHHASLTLILHELEQFDDEALNTPYFHSVHAPLWKSFAAITYKHYADHSGDLIAWLNAHKH